ncbi:exo-alpha-sialidase [bacterium]|nr:exo-alpha-sialidase [bacterium]
MKMWPMVVLLVGAAALAAPQVVTVGGGKSPALATDSEERVHLVYQGLQAGENIYYRQSSDGGRSWNEEVNVSNTPGLSSAPCVAARGNEVAVAWLEDCRDHSSNDIYVSVSSDGGHSFGPAFDVSHTPGRSAYPALAIGPNGSIHVAWSDTSGGGSRPDIFHSSSDNLGKSWTKAVQVTRGHGALGAPAIAVGAGDLVHIAWSDQCRGARVPDIHLVRGMQDTWSPEHDLSPTSEESTHPSVALRPDGRPCLAWLEDCATHQGNDVYFAAGDGQGRFGRMLDVSHTPGVSSAPNLTIDSNGKMYVTWVDTTSGRKAPDIWQSVSQDGRGFSRSRNLSHTPGVCREPRAAGLSNSAVVAWEEKVGGRSLIKVLPGLVKSE